MAHPRRAESKPLWDSHGMRESSPGTWWGPVAGGAVGAVAALIFRAVLDGGITGPAVIFAVAFGVTWAVVGLVTRRRRERRREPARVEARPEASGRGDDEA